MQKLLQGEKDGRITMERTETGRKEKGRCEKRRKGEEKSVKKEGRQKSKEKSEKRRKAEGGLSCKKSHMARTEG